jgi:hypothetical protein
MLYPIGCFHFDLTKTNKSVLSLFRNVIIKILILPRNIICPFHINDRSNVLEDYNRELIACIPEHSFSGQRVARELNQIMEAKEIKPRSISMDNGTEFTSKTFMSWT